MNPQNIKDIKQAIIDKKVAPGREVLTECFYIHRFKITLAIITEIPGTGYIDANNIRTHIGIARKRKGDKYNQDTGEIIALLNSTIL